MARAAPRRPPRKKEPKVEREPSGAAAPGPSSKERGPKDRRAPATQIKTETEKKRRATKGERAQERAERKRQRRAHRAGMRAIWRDRWTRFSDWLWPSTTRDIGRAKATLVLVLNIAPFPGLGTALYGRVERGAAQFALTFVFLIGWVWAITDGIRIAQVAYGGSKRVPRRRPAPSHPRADEDASSETRRR